MKSKIARVVALPIGVGAAALACSTVGTTPLGDVGPRILSDASVTPEGVGELRMELTFPDGEFVGTIAYILSNGGGATVQQGTVATANGPSTAFQLGRVPAGDGYTLTLTATLAGGGRCIGSAGPFTVAAHSTVMERAALQCTSLAPDAGNVQVATTISYCGAWTSLSSVAASGNNGSEVNVGFTIQLGATALGPDPPALTYTWSQSNVIGTFGPDSASGTSDAITFTCVTPGTTTVTLVVGDGVLPDGSLCPSALSTVTATLTCDTPFCNQPSDCPGSNNACAILTCIAHACGTSFVAAGTITAAQTAGDCHRNECDGAGNIASVIDNTDLPPNTNPCVAIGCSAGVPTRVPKPLDAVCSAGPPATFCDGNGSCLACIAASDCGMSTACAQATCVQNNCGVREAPEGTSCGTNQICDGGGACVPFTVSVVRVGTGAAALGVTTAAVTIEQRSVPDGNLLLSTPLPTTSAGSNQPLTNIGLAILGDGDLQRSADGRYLLIAGYAAPPGTNVTSNNSDAGAAVPRVVGRLDRAGNVDTTTTLAPSAFASQPVRSVASLDGSTFWVGGASPIGATPGGIWYVPWASVNGGVQLYGASLRRVVAAQGQLYGDGDTAAAPEIFAVGAGMPTSGTPTLQELPGMPTLASASPWSFVFFDLAPPAGVDTLYVADDRALDGDAAAAQNGVQKWSYNGATWALTNVFNLSPPVGFRGVTGISNGASVTLIASTRDNRLVAFVDGGGPANGVVFATAPANTQFRGVALTPSH